MPKKMSPHDAGMWVAKPFADTGAFNQKEMFDGSVDVQRTIAAAKATAMMVVAAAVVGLSLQANWSLPDVDLHNVVPTLNETLSAPGRYAEGKIQHDSRTTKKLHHLVDNEKAKSFLVDYIHSAYHLPVDAARNIVQTVARVSRETSVDPFLIFGVMATESSLNKDARSSYGAVGLMQVHPPSHGQLLENLGLSTEHRPTVEAVLKSNVSLNVRAGAHIIKEYTQQYGTQKMGLWAYNGKPKTPDGQKKLGYVDKVIAYQQTFEAHAKAPEHNNFLKTDFHQ